MVVAHSHPLRDRTPHSRTQQRFNTTLVFAISLPPPSATSKALHCLSFPFATRLSTAAVPAPAKPYLPDNTRFWQVTHSHTNTHTLSTIQVQRAPPLRLH